MPAVVLLAALLLPNLFVKAQASPTVGEPSCPEYAWIDFGPEIRETSGALTRQYQLRLAGARADESAFQCSDIHDWQPRYRLSDQSRSGSLPDGALSDDRWYSLPMTYESHDGVMAITAPVALRVQLVVTGSCTDREGRHLYVAQTDQSLFGRASAAEQTERTPVGPPADSLPMLHLQPSRTNYYMQTGWPYYFSCTGDMGSVEGLLIIEDGKPLAQGPELSAGGASAVGTSAGGASAGGTSAGGASAVGAFTYTAGHDRRLEKGGPYAVKKSVVLLETLSGADHRHTTFSMQLHRSILANTKPLSGMILFGITALATLSAVLGYRRLQNTRW